MNIDVWTRQPSFRGIGLPKNDRVKALLNLTTSQKLHETPNVAKDPLPQRLQTVMQDVILDFSQNPARRKYSDATGQCMCLCSSSRLYHFGMDRCLFPIEYLRLQGWGMDVEFPQGSESQLRVMAGQGMALPCLATVIWAAYMLHGLPGGGEPECELS